MLAGPGCSDSAPGAGVDTVEATSDLPGLPDSAAADGAGPDALPVPDALPATDVPAPVDTCSDCVPADLCLEAPGWEAQNLRSLQTYGLRHSTAVVTGTLGAPVTVNNSRYAPLTVYTVYYGWTFLVGQTALVPLPAGLEPYSAGTRWVVGLSQSHPVPWDADVLPYWGNVTVIMPEGDVTQDGIAWRRDLAPLVGVARITARDAERVTFELVTPIQGEWPATVFKDNWYESWGADYPDPSDMLYLVSLTGLTEYPGAQGEPSMFLGSVLDVRPSYDSLVAQASASAPAPDLTALRAVRDRLHLAWRFKRAKDVATGEVTGLADECCTGAGGTYVRYDRKEVLAGAAPEVFTLGGHAYYGPEQCGQQWLVAPTAWSEGPQMDEPFECPSTPSSLPSTQGWTLQLPATAEAVADVKAWLAAAPPVLQLHPEGDASPAAEPAPALPWAATFDAADAFSLATHIALFTVLDVSSTDSGHVVTLETTWSPVEYEHLTKERVSLAFRCGDPRLMVVGARLLAPVVRLTDPQGGAADPESSFLILGALAPEWVLTSDLQNLLAQRL